MDFEKEVQAELEENNQPQEKKESLLDEVFGYVEAFVYAVFAVILLLSFVFRVTVVDGTSMNPTLNNLDKVIMTHLFTELETGDVVVLDSEYKGGITLIKRVIAVGGQMVDIDKETGAIYVDGVMLEEEYISEPIDYWHIGDHEYPIIVDDGHLFVVGDNRNGSIDSRFAEVGLIDERYVVGKVFLRVAPITQIKVVK